METSFQLDQIDANPECIAEERKMMAKALGEPKTHLTYTPRAIKEIRFPDRPVAGIFLTDGSNGDRELAGLAHLGGFATKDIMLTDLMEEKVSLDDVQVLMSAGGFSKMDEPFEAGMACAATMLENPYVSE